MKTMTEKMTIRTVRAASTGKYHRSYEGANITFCNASGQIRITRLITATERELERASADSFCRKCFPNGAPGRELDSHMKQTQRAMAAK